MHLSRIARFSCQALNIVAVRLNTHGDALTDPRFSLPRDVLRDALHEAHVDNMMLALHRAHENDITVSMLHTVSFGLFKALTPEAAQYLAERHGAAYLNSLTKGADGTSPLLEPHLFPQPLNIFCTELSRVFLSLA